MEGKFPVVTADAKVQVQGRLALTQVGLPGRQLAELLAPLLLFVCYFSHLGLPSPRLPRGWRHPPTTKLTAAAALCHPHRWRGA